MIKPVVTDTSLQQTGLETALRSLARLLKAGRYYPPRHPALEAAAGEARHSFVQQVPADHHLLLTVRREGFLHGEVPIANHHPILKKLAGHLFARRVQTLLFLHDLSERDLHAFVRCLALEPSIIQQMGGIGELMARVRISTVWVNETDLTRIKARREEWRQEESLPGQNEEELSRLLELGQPEEAAEEENDLVAILRELRRTESDQHYRQLLQDLLEQVRQSLADADRYLILEALLLLHQDITASGRSALRRGLARQALDQLASDELLDYLVGFLCMKGVDEETRQHLRTVLAFFPEQNVPRMMERLAVEESLPSRRFLLEALVACGPAAVPLLTGFLGDGRWFVVRNAISVLGEIRAPEVAASLPPLLQHRDIRVAREAIRALTKIGGSRAVGILLQLVEAENQELSRHALLSLAATKNQAAVPTLLKIVNRPDPLVKEAELKKGAIKALGEIGTAEAVPALASLLGRRKWWRRSLFDQVRAAAASALGEIGGTAPIPALERAAEDRSPVVARAALHSLKQIRKGE